MYVCIPMHIYPATVTVTVFFICVGTGIIISLNVTFKFNAF